jgi:hypothetical protein
MQAIVMTLTTAPQTAVMPMFVAIPKILSQQRVAQMMPVMVQVLVLNVSTTKPALKILAAWLVRQCVMLMQPEDQSVWFVKTTKLPVKPTLAVMQILRLVWRAMVLLTALSVSKQPIAQPVFVMEQAIAVLNVWLMETAPMDAAM